MKRFLTFALTLAVAALIASAALASEVDSLLDLLVKKGVVTEEEANGLRQEIEAQKTAENELAFAKAEAAKKKPPAVTAKTKVRVSGYAQIRGTASALENDAFLIRRARLTLASEVSPRWDYKLQVDFGNTARTAVTSVDFAKSKTKTTSAQRPVLLDAQANYALNETTKLSFGQFKIPFSYENLVSSTELDTINRAQVVEQLVPGRDIGSQGRDIGLVFAGSKEQLDWAFGVFNGAGINVAEDNDQKDLAARLVFHPNEALAIGASWYDGRTGLRRAAHDRVGGEISYKEGPWTLRGEYVAGKDASTRKAGWYAHAGYRFNPKWEGIVRLDEFDPDREAGDDGTEVVTFGFNRFLSDTVKLQVNYERKDEEGAEVSDNALLAQLQVKF